MSEWKYNRLKEITTKIGSGSTPTGGGESYKEQGISLIRSQNILDLSFSTDGLAFIDDDQAYALRSVTVEEDDVLLNITGDSVARVCMVPKKLLPGRVNQHVAIIRANKEKLSAKFLLYSLISQKETLLTLSEIGATRRALTKTMLEDFEVALPPLPQQQSIAEVLSSLDDKIDLLHQQNKTLEALAETLFRQWFVEEVEEEWQIKPVGEIFETVGGGTPSTNDPEFWDGNINWTSPKDLSNSTKLFMTNTSRTITEAGLKKISSGLLPLGTVLLSSRAPIGYLAITDIPVSINQGYIACLANKKYSSWYIHNWIKQNIDVIINAANGSTFLEISKSVFRKIEFVVPPDEKLSKFNQHAESYYNKIKINENQIQTLETLRNNLLPKLMSGAVRVGGQ